MTDNPDPRRPPVRSLRRLRYEAKDWCRSARGTACNRTHAAKRTAQHSPEVWSDGD